MNLPDLGLRFDEEAHVYYLDHVPLASVTTIMRPMSLMLYDGIPRQTMSVAASRGTRAHEQVSNFVMYGVLEKDDDTAPYIDAFTDFTKAYNPSLIASEYRVYHKGLMYAGTLDLAGYIEPDDGTGIDLIDLKTTSSFYRVMLSTQLGAYKEALESHGIKVRNLYGLQLLKNGKYRFHRVDNGFKTFLHCLALHNDMANELHR